MAEKELPEWVQPGATVAVYWAKFGERRVHLAKVERHTKTQIVLVNDHRRFYKTQGSIWGDVPRFEMVGSGKQWSPLCFLTDPEHPRIKEIQLETLCNKMALNLRDAAQGLLKEGGLTSENAAEVGRIAQKLQYFLEGAQK